MSQYMKQQIIILNYLWSTNYAKIMTLYKILAGNNNIFIAFLKILISLTWGADKIKAPYSHFLSLIIKGRLFSRKKLSFFDICSLILVQRKIVSIDRTLIIFYSAGKQAHTFLSSLRRPSSYTWLEKKDLPKRDGVTTHPISATHERCRQRGCSSFILESGDTTWIHRQCLLVLVL